MTIKELFEDDQHHTFSGLRSLIKDIDDDVSLFDFYKVFIEGEYFHILSKEEILIPEYNKRRESLIKYWTET